MANYNSIPRRFNKVTSNINHAYIDATLKDKQNTIDSNFGLLQQTVDQTLGQDLIRESDRNYLKDKVKGVLNSLDNTDSIKFDSKRARFSIQDALSKASKDPEILKQVANTRKIRQVQEFYKKRSEKGDLNQQNFNYAYTKTGVNGYLNGNSNDLGEFQYLEYVDVDAKLDDTARKLKAANPNEKVSIQNPLTGKTVSKKVSMITPEEMRNYLRVQLNSNDLKQLEIDGAMLYGMDNSKAIKHRDMLIDNNNKKYSDNVALLENYRDNGNKTEGEIEIINEQIKSLGAEKALFEKSMIGQKTAESIGGQQLMENKMDLFSKLYTKNGPQSIKYDNDFLKRMRDANSAANVKQNSSGNPNISTITVPSNLPDKVNPYQDSLNRIDVALKNNSDYLTNQFNSLTDDKKKLVKDTMEQIKSDPQILALYKGQPLSNETLQLETINRLGANFFPPDVAMKIKSSINSSKAIQEGIEKTTSEFVKTQVLNKDIFDQVFKEETNLTMATTEGDVNVQQFLKDNGVTNYETYKSFINSDSKQSKQLRATLSLQSMSLTNDLSGDDFTILPGAGTGFTPIFNSGIGSTNKLDLNESEYRMMRQSVHDLTGESLDETYNVIKKDGKYILNLKNSSTNFSKIVGRTNQLYQDGRVKWYDAFIGAARGGFGLRDTDRTARNESSIRGLFEDDNYREFAENNLTYLDNTVAGSNSIRIKGNNKKIVDPIYEEILQYSDNVTFDKRLPIDIYKKENGELLITQIVQDETAVDNDEAKDKQKIRQGVIQANDVKKMSLFNNQITLLQKNNSFKTLEDISGKVNRINFIGDNRQQIEGLNRLYDRNIPTENMFRKMSAHKTARDIIFDSNTNQYMPTDHPIRAQFEDFVKNTQDYKLDFTKGIDSDYQVIITNKEGENIGSIPINKNIPIESFEKAYQGTPQVFLSLYSQYQVKKYKDQLISNVR